MATQAQRRKWRSSVERALNERDGAERYALRQREFRRGQDNTNNDRPGPLEFDPLGFPIPQPIPDFMRRIGRLINGD